MGSFKRKHFHAALRSLGFEKRDGGPHGHERWVNGQGREVRPSLRKDEVPYAYAYATGKALEAIGAASRQEFIKLLKTR